MQRVKYLGASLGQVAWGGNDDPRKVLIVGEIYEVIDSEMHNWHTKIRLAGIAGQFNDSSFEYVAEEELDHANPRAD